MGSEMCIRDRTVFIAPQELRYAWDWCPRGERCDGTLARPYARGGYVALGWAPPSRQGTEVPRRGVAAARVRRPFARAKRGPTNGVAPAAPRSPTRKGLAPRSALNMGGGCGQPPVPSCRRPQQWGRPAARLADGHIAAGDLHTPTSNLEQTTSFKKKVIFFGPLGRPGPRTGPGPPAPPASRRRLLRSRGAADCAVGSG